MKSRTAYSHRMIQWIIACCCLPWVAVFATPLPERSFPQSTGLQFKNGDMSTATLNAATTSGAGTARKGIYWSTIESQIGVYDWTETDSWIQDMESRGFSMVITIVWNNRLYEDIWDRAIVTEPGRQAFAGFAADLVQRYQGKDIIWEIWNEPNLRSFWHENAENKSNTDEMAEEYTALVKVAAPAMKAADANCRIVAGSVSALWSQSFSWFERCVEVGLLTSGIDGISVHPYGFGWPELAMENGYPVIRQILDSNGASTMPIINSEVGYSENWLTQRGFSTAEAETVQAWQFVRQNLVDAMSDIRISIWYELTDPGWGVFNNDLTPRPTLTAAQVLTTELDGYQFVERLPLSSSLDYAVVFEEPFSGDRKLVAWTTPDSSASLKLPVSHSVQLPVGAAGDYEVVDLWGNSTLYTTSTEELSLTITGAPVYIPLKSTGSSYRNLALNKNVTASSNPQDAHQLTDGEFTTGSRWFSVQADGYPQWVEVDLGGIYTIDQVLFSQFTERTDDYTVEIWDGAAWVSVASGTANTEKDIWVSFNPVATDKVRFNVTQGELYLKVYEFEVYGDDSPPPSPDYQNVALNKSVTASSNPQDAHRLTDGLYTTNSRWFSVQADGFPQWVEVDLGGTYSIDQVVFSQFTERTDDYTVEIWDGSAWVSVATGTANTEQDISVSFTPVTTDKVRFTVTQGQLYLKVYEFEVYGVEATAPPPPEYQNLALNKSVTASSNPQDAHRLTDGVYTTNSRWFSVQADGYPQWIEVDLGDTYTIDQVLFSQFTERTDDYTVEIWNGSAWVSVASGVANTEQDIWVSFTPVATDKVRFTVTQGQLYLKVYELEVYGND